MEYINKAAYAFMSLSGKAFCSSAYNGLLLNMKHGAKFAFANYLAAMFILLGKVGLTMLNVFLTSLVMKSIAGSAAEVASPLGPLILCGVFTFLIVSVFLGLFDESVMAMLMCTAADMDLHGGDTTWGPETLQRAINEINGTEDSYDKKDQEGENANQVQ